MLLFPPRQSERTTEELSGLKGRCSAVVSQSQALGELYLLCLFDSQGHVVMGNNAVSPYQQVIEKTKSLSFRSQMLAMNIEKKVAHSNRNEVR